MTNKEWLSTLSEQELADLFYLLLPAKEVFIKWLKEERKDSDVLLELFKAAGIRYFI